MTLTWKFIVYGIPKAQGRHRTSSFIASGKAFSHMYEANKDKVNKDNIRAQVVNQNPTLIKVPVVVNMLFYLPRPKNHYGKKGLLPSAPKKMITKPDLDNLEKAVMDALTGVCWEDDRLIVGKTSMKEYVEEEMSPRTEITVMT